MAASLPSNVHVSTHPCLRAKLSQLRSQGTSARETKQLVHDIALIVGCEALDYGLSVQQTSTDSSPLGYEYPVETLSPSHISLVPILRSGLSMIDALQSLLPNPVPIYHLGMYREKSTLQPVEYYNNLPYHTSSSSTNPPTSESTVPLSASQLLHHDPNSPSDLAILVDPIIATGATASAAIDTLKDWGVKRIIVCSVLASVGGLQKASEAWGQTPEKVGASGQGRGQGENVVFWVGGVDAETDEKGMIKPGLGDIGDRLFGTIGK